MPRLCLSKSLTLLFLTVLLVTALPACQPQHAPRPSPTFRPIPTRGSAVAETAAPLPTPGTAAPAAREEVLVDTLAEGQSQAGFELLQPFYVPDRLPLARVAVRNLEGGARQARLIYAYQRAQPESSPRYLAVEQTNGGPPYTAETIRRADFGALDVLPAQVRGQQGFLYWTHTEAGQVSNRLAWREGDRNLLVELVGSWAGADAARPHGLDGLLLMVASSLGQSGESWQAHYSSVWGVTFAVPSDWQPDGSDAWLGSGGYARLEAFDGPGQTLAQACEWEANAHPRLYGSQPELSSLAEIHLVASLCSIRPDSGAGALLFSSGRANPRFLILRVSAAHLLAVAGTLVPQYEAAGSPVPVSTLPAVDVIQPAAREWQGLKVEAYRLGPFASGSPDVIRGAPAEIMQKRQAIRSLPTTAAPITVQGQAITLAEIHVNHPFAENRQVQVLADGTPIFRYNLLAGSTETPKLIAREDQWILNLSGMLVVDGEIQNERMGYDSIYGWTLLGGKPFYFFSKDGWERLSYDGVLFEEVYSRVFCCGEPPFDTGSNERMAWFYAVRENSLYYLELTRLVP